MTIEKNIKNNDVLSVLLQLEEDARNTEDLLSLHYFIVNETRRLLHYRHAVLFNVTGRKKVSFQAIRTSGATLVDRSIPKIRWLEQVVDALIKENSEDRPIKVTFENLHDSLQRDWQNFSLQYPVWIPFKLPDGFLIGSFWVERESAWNENELQLIKRLGRHICTCLGLLR